MNHDPKSELEPKGEPVEGHAADAFNDPAANATADKAREGEAIAAGGSSVKQKAKALRGLADDKLVALAEEASKADHWLDVARRAQAELDNTIKRLRRDQQEALRYANSGLVRDLLPVMDNLSRALGAAESSQDFKSLFEGLQLTARMFEDALGRNAVTPVDAQGQPFDPALHEAVMMASDEKLDDNAVAAVLERGWKLHDRVLRAAKVSVNRKS